MNYPQYILDYTLDTIFPVKCIGCKKLMTSKQGYLCQDCFKKISLNKTFECIGCKTTSSLGTTCFKCKRSIYLDQLLSAYSYKDPLVSGLIKSLKYRFVADTIKPLHLLARKYVTWLSSEKKFNLIQDSPLLIPVPLCYRRLNWRGFNQAHLIAQSLSDMFQLEIKTNVLIKNRSVKSQADIDEREERFKNITSDIFSIANHDAIKNRTVILVDDVCTTGATMNECARILKESGTIKVIGFTIARG